MYSYEEEYDPQGSHVRGESEPRRAAWQWSLLALLLFGSLSSYAYLDSSLPEIEPEQSTVEPKPPINTIRVRPEAETAILNADQTPTQTGTLESKAHREVEADRAVPSLKTDTPTRKPRARLEATVPEVPRAGPTPLRPSSLSPPKQATLQERTDPAPPGKVKIDLIPETSNLTLEPPIATLPPVVQPLPLPALDTPTIALNITPPATGLAQTAPTPIIISDTAPGPTKLAKDGADIILQPDTPSKPIISAESAPEAFPGSITGTAASVPQAAILAPKATTPPQMAPITLNPIVASRAALPAKPKLFKPDFDFKGRYVVQVASFENVVSACAVWEELRAQHPELFDKAETIVRPSRLDSGRSVYRLRVGAFAKRQSAQAWCNAYKKKGGECFVAKR